MLNKDDLTMGQMERKIRQLENELAKERRVNEENRMEMVQLEKEIEEIGKHGNNRECDLQNKLDEQYLMRR